MIASLLAPEHRTGDLESKLSDHRSAGTVLVWVIDPARRSVVVREADTSERHVSAAETLDGGNGPPGFSLPIAKLFDALRAET
ncbi:MAG: hypothetical protein ACREPM_03835 [Gemmatimonadaceae bacterium]